MINKLTQLANSPQGKRLADKAKAFANDPKTRAQVESAKRKLGELRDNAQSRNDRKDDPPKAA